MIHRNLVDLCHQLESDLADFYGFNLHARAIDHFLSDEQVQKLMPTPPRRAQVLLVQDHRNEEIFIGIHLQRELLKILEAQNPLISLTNSNLDVFCTLAEEISHFHLILNRATNGRTLQAVELEWQGEVDKVLTCAINLKRLYGNPHLQHLTRVIFEESHIMEELNDSLYHQANKYAARYWYDLITYGDGLHDPANSKFLKSSLQHTYHQGWEAKIQSVFYRSALRKIA